jgi:DUF1680 family protein
MNALPMPTLSPPVNAPPTSPAHVTSTASLRSHPTIQPTPKRTRQLPTRWLSYEFTGRHNYLQLALAIESEWAQPAGSNNFLANALAGHEFYTGVHPRWETLHDMQAIAELYLINGQPLYSQAFGQIWGSIRKFDRHATGGFTSGEAATGNPFDPRYIETCGTVAWMALSIDMLRIGADPTAADELELSLFNAILGAPASLSSRRCSHMPT